MKRTLAVTGFTMLGTLLVFCYTTNIEAIGVTVLVAFIAFLLSLFIKILRKDRTIPTALISVVIALTVLLVSDVNYTKNVEKYNDNTVSVVGSLASLPYKQNGRSYYVIKTTQIGNENKSLQIRLVSSSPIDFEPTDTISANIKVFLLGADEEEYVNYYKSKNLSFGAYAVDDVKIEKANNFSPLQLILKFRSKMIYEIHHAIPNDYGAVLTGLVLGDKSSLSYKTENAFRFCGVSHLFAVSGLHITVWSMLFFEAIKRLGFSSRKASIFAILFSLFFMALTGFNPPVVRAGVMIILVLIGNLFEREADSINSIGLALTIMLLINPYSALSVSLLLSLLATLGIIILATPISEKIMSTYSIKLGGKKIVLFLNSIVSLIVVSISVSIFTLPIYIFSFKSISTLQLISNLLMISLGTLSMEIAGVSAFLCVIGLGVFGKPLMLIAGMLSKILVNIAYTLSAFRYAVFPLNTTYTLVIVLIILIGCGLIYLFKIRNIRVLVCLGVFSILILFSGNIFSFYKDFNRLKIGVASVGDGVGIVATYKGKNIVFSCGGDYFAESEICDIMNLYGISTIDYLCLPNGYSHYSKLANGYNVKSIYCNDTSIERFAIPLNKSVITTDDLTIGLENNIAQIIYEGKRIIILFSDDINAKAIDGDILIYRNKIPYCVNKDSFSYTIGAGALEESEEVVINSNKSFKYGRIN